jgi:hypothetical protein
MYMPKVEAAIIANRIILDFSIKSYGEVSAAKGA